MLTSLQHSISIHKVKVVTLYTEVWLSTLQQINVPFSFVNRDSKFVWPSLQFARRKRKLRLTYHGSPCHVTVPLLEHSQVVKLLSRFYRNNLFLVLAHSWKQGLHPPCLYSLFLQLSQSPMLPDYVLNYKLEK